MRYHRRLEITPLGEVAEWLNATVSKTVRPATVSGVRIPPSPFPNSPQWVVDVLAIASHPTP